MNEPAVVSLLWHKNLHVLQNYLLTRPCTVLTLAQNVGTGFRELMAQAGGKVRALEELLDDEARARAERAAVQAAAAYGSHLASPAWSEFGEHHGINASEFGGLTARNLAVRLYEQILIVEALDKAAEVYNIEFAVLSEDLSRHCRTIVEWAREAQVPSLHLQHALPLVNPFTVHKALNADKLAAFGTRGAEAYLDLGLPAERVVLTGNPAWDVYPQLRAQRERLRQGLAAKFGFDARRPLIVFGTTWVAYLSAAYEPDAYASSLEAFLRAGQSLRQRGIDAVLLIKDRPPNAAFGKETCARVAAALGLSESDYRHVVSDTEALVCAADIVVSVDSNLSVEAMMAGTPAVNLLNDLGLRMGPCFDAESGILEVPQEELADTLEAVLKEQSLRQLLLERMDAARPRYNFGYDGNAGELVARVMTAMVHPETEKTVVPAVRIKYAWQRLNDLEGEALQGMYHDSRRQELIAMLERPPRRVLDIGCATGSTGTMIKEKWPGAFVAGIEFNRLAADKAKTRLDLVISEKLEETDLEARGIPPHSIDTVILADVLEHMYDPWSTLLRLHPYLTPDAQVLTSIPNIRNFLLLNEIVNGRFTYTMDGLLDVTHIRFFTLNEMEKMLRETGYEVYRRGQTWDGRMQHLEYDPGKPNLETEKLLIKNVGEEELNELRTVQFLLLSRPMQPLPEDVETAVLNRRRVLPAPTPLPGRKRRLVVYSSEHPDWACARLRLSSPLSLLAHEWEVVWGMDWDRTPPALNEEVWRDADLVLVQRYFPMPETAELLERMFAADVPLAYDMDDLVDMAPEAHPHRAAIDQSRPYVLKVMRGADIVFVSTEVLSETVRPHAQNVRLLPNLVDLRLFARPVPTPGSSVRIGLLGTGTHAADYALLEPVLSRLLDKYGDRVEIVVMGMRPPVQRQDVTYVEFEPSYEAYAAKLGTLRLDLALAPLLDNTFNRCKSNIKWLEYSAAGIAGIYSDLPPYACIRHGETGLLAENTAEAWLAAIEELIEYPEKRSAIAQAAQREVFERHAL
jgi:2-polyprenyl-3-methyl-5-hydroxy-6-metoxy-1,4-benzoquinol methylase/glycosyltransferase involved in cell wall biosynthesis